MKVIILYPNRIDIKSIKHPPGNYSLYRLINDIMLHNEVYIFNRGFKYEEEKIKFYSYKDYNFIEILKFAKRIKAEVIISQLMINVIVFNILKFIYPIKIIFRTGGVGTSFEDIKNHKITTLIRWFLIFKFTDQVICTRDGTKSRALAKYFKAESKMNILPNGVFIMNPTVSETKRENYEKRVAIISRLDKIKRPDIPLRAFIQYCEFNKIDNISLDIIGDGLIKDQLISLSEKKAKKIKINFMGKIINAQNLVKDYDLILNTISYNLILESIVNNKPIITVDYGEINYEFDAFKNVYIIKYGKMRIKEKDEKDIIKSYSELIPKALKYIPKELPLDKLMTWSKRIRIEKQIIGYD